MFVNLPESLAYAGVSAGGATGTCTTGASFGGILSNAPKGPVWSKSVQCEAVRQHAISIVEHFTSRKSATHDSIYMYSLD